MKIEQAADIYQGFRGFYEPEPKAFPMWIGPESLNRLAVALLRERSNHLHVDPDSLYRIIAIFAKGKYRKPSRRRPVARRYR